jgi:replicative DNA helicase
MPDGASPGLVNLEAEQALLGCILINNESHDRVSEFLRAEHFGEAVHARIYEAAQALIAAGRLASPITLKTFFERDTTLAEIGGAAYLARLAGAATTVVNVAEYGRIIVELFQRRALIKIGTDIAAASTDAEAGETPQELIEGAERALYEASERKTGGDGFQPFGVAVTESIDMIAGAYQRDSGLCGMATGLIDLDRKLGGLQQSDLIVLAGRPAMGKTAMGTNIA